MQQQVYPFEQHQLDIQKIDEHALYILQKLRDAGFIAYLVGGGVRDLLLDRRPKDYDISTSASPEEIRKLFRNSILIGKRFRLAHIRFGHKIFEVSTFRSGDTETDALILRDNNWGTPEEDALRRDFTINGLFYDAATQTIIDYVGGYADIRKKYLRTIGLPYLRFKQDPVRMLRLIKFQARFGLEIDPEARIALLECRGEILKSSPARILEELLRMLESGAAHSFFKLMTEHGLLQLMMPTLTHAMESSEGGEIFSYLEEVDTTFQEPGTPPLGRPVLLACLLYPILQKRIQDRFIDRGRHPHLGEIYDESHDLIHEVFHPFFLLPRRLKVTAGAILTAQYRLTPIEKRKSTRLRVPSDPDFGFAIHFLEVRASLEPGLQTTLEEWQSVYQSPGSVSKPRRRRRRRKPPSSAP